MRLYEVKMIDGSCYRGEITYKDNKMIVLRLKRNPEERKMRLFYSAIISIQELGWQKAHILQ